VAYQLVNQKIVLLIVLSLIVVVIV